MSKQAKGTKKIESQNSKAARFILKHKRCFLCLYFIDNMRNKAQFLKCWKFSEVIFFFKDYLIYLFLREWGREEEQEREKHQYVRDTSVSCLSYDSNWGPGLQPKHVPWLGIELVTPWVASWCSIHWVTPARVRSIFF